MRVTGNRERETGNRKQGTGNGKQETENRKQKTGKSGDFAQRVHPSHHVETHYYACHGKQGTGNRKQRFHTFTPSQN